MITDIKQAQLAAARSWLDATESLLGDDHRAEASRQIRHVVGIEQEMHGIDTVVPAVPATSRPPESVATTLSNCEAKAATQF